jgi:hypothetical protein
MTFLASLGLLLPFNAGGCAGAGFLGLQDYQRDLLFGLGGGLAGALLDNLLPRPPGDDSGRDVVAEPGPQGPVGPSLFSVYVDMFYTGVASDALGVTPVADADPQLAPDGPSVAFTIAVPTVHETNPVLMRVILYRTGPCTGDCFAFNLDGRRAALGGNTVECFGGAGVDCAGGTRTVLVSDACDGVPGAAPDAQVFVILDLPLSAAGLDLPAVQAGDLLAFELEPVLSDGGTYTVLGVELTDAAGDTLRNATVFHSAADALAACGQGQ